MKKAENLIDDILKLVGSTVGVAASGTQEFKESMRERMQDFIDKLNVVPREDFEALEMRVCALEDKMLSDKKKSNKK